MAHGTLLTDTCYYKYQRIKFLEDSSFYSTNYIIVSPSGNYFLQSETFIEDKKDVSESMLLFSNKTELAKLYEIRYVPQFNIIDSSITTYWSYLLKWQRNLVVRNNQKQFSVLLHLFKEPIISSYGDSIVFRLLSSCKHQILNNCTLKEKQKYILIRVHIDKNGFYIVYKSGSFNEKLEFDINFDTVYSPNNREKRWINKQYRKLSIETSNDSIIYNNNLTNGRMYEIKTSDKEYIYFRAKYDELRKDKNKHLDGLFLYIYYLMLNVVDNDCK